MRIPVLVFALVATVVSALPAAAAIGAWAEGGKARVRLIAGEVDAAGRIEAGLEIDLDPGWHTYWRTPGDSGIAPVFDFTGSHNIGPVEVLFPVPTRLDDGFAVTNVYEGRVILPFMAPVADKGASAEFVLKLDIGVCAEVCIPEHFEATVTLTPGETDPRTLRALKAAHAALPAPAEPGRFAVERIWRDGGKEKRPSFAFTAAVPDPEEAEIFVEGPFDWYPDIPKLTGEKDGLPVWKVSFDRLGSKTPLAGARLRVTIVSGGRAIEQWIALD